jgi:putative heme iron utilization protein
MDKPDMKKPAKRPDPDVSTRVRRLLRSSDRASLATRLVDGDWPHASLVVTASGFDGSPILLLSDLAEHGKNLAADNRASLLFDGTRGLDNPLTGLRATAVGRIAPVADAALAERYVRRHPDAEMYAGFKDFRFYRMNVERVHAVAGFGAIHWLPGTTVLYPAGPAADLAVAESDVVSHMNDDHGEAIGLYATKLLGLPSGGWRMTGIDPEGIDLRWEGSVARLDFEQPIANPEEARAELVRLVKSARQTLS